MRYSHVLGAAIVGLAATQVAQAGLGVPFITPVNNSSASLPTGARTYDLQVLVDAGTKWSSGDLQFSLATAGAFAGTSFYNDTVGGGNVQQVGASGVTVYDTFVTSPLRSTGGSSAVAVLGKAQAPVESGIGAAVFPTAASGDTAVDVAWGDTSANSQVNGTYTIARFTILGSGGGNLFGRVGATNNSPAPVSFANLYLPILGDTNLDRTVDAVDFTNVLNNLGSAGPTGDTNADGTVDAVDFTNVLNNLGNSLPASGASLGAVVPEPASLGLAGMFAVGMLARRRAR